MPHTLETPSKTEENKKATALIQREQIIGKKVFITQSNMASIINLLSVPVTFQTAAHKIFPRSAALLTQKDLQLLQATKWVFQHPEEFLEWSYQKTENIDTHPSMVFNNHAPAYHLHEDCPRLHADYINIEIPAQIQQQGAEKIEEFKIWANIPQIRQLFEENIDLFKLKLATQFKISLHQLNLIIYENSGYTTTGNENLDEIQRLINTLLEEEKQFTNASQKNRAILHQYKKFTGLGFGQTSLHSNHTGYPEKEVKALLRDFRGRFQIPLRRFLISYMRIRYNPKLHFSGTLLDQLGFNPCRKCHAQIQKRRSTFYKKESLCPLSL